MVTIELPSKYYMKCSLVVFLTILVAIECLSMKCGVRDINLQYGTAIDDNIDSISPKNDFTQFGEFPWVVAILKKVTLDDGVKVNVYHCSGSLLHPRVVLTSASCVNAEGELIVRAGEWDIQTKEELFPHEDRTVTKMVIHPEYSISDGSLNDLALFVFDEPFPLRENINTICLPSQDEVLENSRCAVSGWRTGGFAEKPKYEHIMKQVKLPIVQRDDCIKRVGSHFNLSATFICAGGELEEDKCLSDEGGPLVCPIPGKSDEYYQRGIVAWGFKCGNTDIPYVYTNLASYRNWIDNEMQKLNLTTTSYTY